MRILISLILINLFAVGYVYSQPDCKNVKIIAFEPDQFSNEESRFKFSANSDSLKSLYCYSIKNKIPELEAFALYRLSDTSSDVFGDEDVFEKSISLLNKSIEVGEANNLFYPLLFSYERLCTIFTTNKLFKEASYHASNYIAVAQEKNDSLKLAEGHMLKGRLLREAGDYEAGENELLKSLSYIKNGASPRISAYCYLHLANLKRKEEKYEESLKYVKKGIQEASVSSSQSIEMIAFLSIEEIIANLALKIKDNDIPLANIKKGLNTEDWLINQYHFLNAQVLALNNKKEEAFKEFMVAYNFSKKHKNHIYTIEIAEELFNIYNDEGVLSPEINQIIKEVKEANDYIINQNGSENFLKTIYYKLETQEKNSELLKVKLVTSRRFLYFFLATTTLMGLILALIYIQNKNKKKYLKTVNALNNQLTALVEKLSVQTFELNQSNSILEQNSEKQANVISRLKKFSSILAHDVKEPVRTILSYNQLLSKTILPKLNEEESDYYNIMVKSSKRMFAFVERLFKYSSNTIMLFEKFEPASLNEVIEDVQIDLNELIKDTETQIEVEELGEINSDELLLYQVFLNLINNSIKYRKEGHKPKIHISNKINEKNELIVSVADNGRGLERKPNLDLFKYRTQGNELEEGSGIGLATCKEIMEIHGGRIWYESNDLGGTTFFLAFVH